MSSSSRSLSRRLRIFGVTRKRMAVSDCMCHTVSIEEHLPTRTADKTAAPNTSEFKSPNASLISHPADPNHGNHRLDPNFTSSATLISRPLHLKLLTDSHLTQADPEVWVTTRTRIHT